MMPRSFRRTTILLLLVALFATPWVSAEPRPADSARPAQALEPARFDLLHQLWNTLRGLWSETGCGIDPSGRCVPKPGPQPPPTLQTDTGCHIDPNGLCRS
jgi:hypothetical protein